MRQQLENILQKMKPEFYFHKAKDLSLRVPFNEKNNGPLLI